MTSTFKFKIFDGNVEMSLWYTNSEGMRSRAEYTFVMSSFAEEELGIIKDIIKTKVVSNKYKDMPYMGYETLGWSDEGKNSLVKKIANLQQQKWESDFYDHLMKHGC
mgnify:CR=1 FL=1